MHGRSYRAGPLALGIDLGTSSARALLFDRLGAGRGGSKVSYGWRATPDGGAEADVEQLVGHTLSAIDGALSSAGDAGRGIAAVGVTSLWHSLVGVDAEGRPVTPVYSWSDTRSARAAAALRERLNEAGMHERTGAVLHPSYLPARLKWLRDAQPERFGRSRYWMSAAEYLQLRLFGERRVSISMASGTGLFDQNARDWDPEVLAAIPIGRDQLSPVVDLDAPFRGLRREFANRWPTLADVPWLAALGDGACANVGSGCVESDRIALSVGTSAAMRVLFRADEVRIPPGLWCYRLDGARFLLGGALSNGGNVFQWMRERLRVPGDEHLEVALEALPPDGHGLTVLPFLAGQRSPDWNLDARGVMAGLTLATTPTQIVQASLEAVAYDIALVRRLLGAHFPAARTIIASGAALRASRAWARIIADVLGEPLTLAHEEEASARGVALLALEMSSLLPVPLTSIPVVGETIEPRLERHQRYAEAIQRHRELEERLLGHRRSMLGERLSS
jgi:gluconokinase